MVGFLLDSFELYSFFGHFEKFEEKKRTYKKEKKTVILTFKIYF